MQRRDMDEEETELARRIEDYNAVMPLPWWVKASEQFTDEEVQAAFPFRGMFHT